MPRITEQANTAALDEVRAETPSRFTVGGSWDGKTAKGGITYDRKWSNGWGATAYAVAWWDDLPVRPGASKLRKSVGGEITKRF